MATHMARVLIASLAIVLATGVVPLEIPALHAAQQPATADSQPSPVYDLDAERQLLDMANRERAKAGLSPLQKDEGLTQAAREHATEMAAQQKLSHQLSGEPDLEQRLAAKTKIHLDRAGENVAFAGSVDQAQDSLMHSPPHRANLLNAGYNVAGFSVVRNGSLLYVTQDFGHSLPSHSDEEAEVLAGKSVDRVRAQSRLPALQRLDATEAASTACAMAEADSLKATAPGVRALVRYTTPQPQTVPAEATRAIANPSVHAVAVGTCYARTASYPTGVYWVALLFY
ncbi:MAG: CAP domain-containing protein [Terriglobales bacterium]